MRSHLLLTKRPPRFRSLQNRPSLLRHNPATKTGPTRRTAHRSAVICKSYGRWPPTARLFAARSGPSFRISSVGWLERKWSCRVVERPTAQATAEPTAGSGLRGPAAGVAELPVYGRRCRPVRCQMSPAGLAVCRGPGTAGHTAAFECQ